MNGSADTWARFTMQFHYYDPWRLQAAKATRQLHANWGADHHMNLKATVNQKFFWLGIKAIEIEVQCLCML